MRGAREWWESASRHLGLALEATVQVSLPTHTPGYPSQPWLLQMESQRQPDVRQMNYSLV